MLRAEPDVGGGGGTIVFESNWSHATGQTDAALQDNFLWDEQYCTASNVMNVIDGDAVGWTLTPNCMEMTNKGETACGLVQATQIVPVATSYYVQLYIRVSSALSMTTNHTVKINVFGDIQHSFWALENANGSTYAPKMQYVGNTEEDRIWTLHGANLLPVDTWHRHQWHVDIINGTQFRSWPRIYNMAGTLIRDASHFQRGDLGLGTITMQEYHDGGGADTYTDAQLMRNFGLGMEGPGGSGPGDDEHWYYAGARVTTGDWPEALAA